MPFPVIAILALIAVTVLYLMVILARARLRAQIRAERLRDAADPARGSGALTHEAGDGHDDTIV